MDDLERALRAVLDDPAQMQQLRAMAGSLGFELPLSNPPAGPAAQAEPAAAIKPPIQLPASAALPHSSTGTAAQKQEALLLALRPFLRKERQAKIDRALHAAKLAALAGQALKNRKRDLGSKEMP